MSRLKKDQVDIYFSKSEIKPKESTDNCLVFYPCKNPWNDQCYETLYDLKLYFHDMTYDLDRLTRIIFEGEQGDYKFLKEIGRDNIKVADVSVKFLSQIDSHDDFKRLADVVGQSMAIELLLKIHDASILKSVSPLSKDLELSSERVFIISLLRNSVAYRAFINGPGVIINDENILPPALNLRFKVPRFSNEHDLDLEFETNSLIDSRLAVFVGKNGVGKTQAIYNLVNQVLGQSSSNLKEVCPYSRVVLFSSIANDYYIKEFLPNDLRGMYYKYVNLVNKDSNGSLLNAIKTILRGGHSDDMKERRLDFLVELLKRNIDFNELLLPTKDLEAEEINGVHLVGVKEYFQTSKEVDRAEFLDKVDPSKNLVFWSKGKEVQLSAGQEFFANLIGKVLGALERGSLLLFDEPETYLHPNLEVDFINMLQEILTASSSYAVIATHSVFITREVPRSHVFVFTERDRRIHIARPQIQTFGASLDQISDYIFGDLGVKKAFEKNLKEKARSFTSLESFFERYKRDLNPNTILMISSLLEDDEIL